MKKLYAILVLVSGMHTAYSQVRISMITPKHGHVYDNYVNIEGYAASDAGPIISVKARAGNIEQEMNVVRLPYFFGGLNLEAFPEGPVQLHIIATDQQQNQLDTVIMLHRDPGPRLVIDDVATTGIARPMMRIKVKGTDNTPVKSMKLQFGINSYTFYKDEIDTIIDASLEMPPLTVSVTDSLGRVSTAGIRYTINVSPAFNLVYAAPLNTTILGYHNNRVLIGGTGSGSSITDITTGATVKLPYNGHIGEISENGKAAWLTAQGAYFTEPVYFNKHRLWAFNGDAVQLLQDSVKRVRSRGEAVAWTAGNGDSLFYKSNMGSPPAFIAKNILAFALDSAGHLVYAANPSIYRYKNGVTTTLYTHNENNYLTYFAEADRDYVAYNSAPLNGRTYLRLLHNGIAEDLIRTDHMTGFGHHHFKLRRGSIAYTNERAVDGAPEPGMFLKLPGDSARLINPSVNARPEGIDSSGGVLFSKEEWLSYIPLNGSEKELAWGFSQIFEEPDGWYAQHYNALYKVSTEATTTYQALPDTRPIFFNTKDTLTLSDFTSHYTGPENGLGQLQEIVITRIPTWCNLYRANGWRIGSPNTRLKRSELEGMYIVPIHNLIGADTIRWKGFSETGFIGGRDTAITIIVYPDLTAKPKLSGLDSTYTTASAPDYVKILNLPPEKWRTSVTITLDSSTILPMVTDTTFRITPSDYAGGIHTLQVKYRHPLDSIVTTARFFVVLTQQRLAVANAGTGAAPQELKVSPNPFTSRFTLQGLDAGKRYTLSLHGVSGNLVYSKVVSGLSMVAVQPDTPLASGVYYLKVFDVKENKVTRVVTVVKM